MSFRSIKLGQQRGQWVELVGPLGHPRFVQFNPRGWRPAINAYRCQNCIRVCVDLAGVERSFIEIHVESHRLVIRGQRLAPEPMGKEHRPVRVLALEIDYGPFEREVTLEAEVEPDRATTEQSNGLLWILLPLRSQS